MPTTTFHFKPGCSVKPTSTSATHAEKELDVNLRHNELQRILHDRLSTQYGKENVGTERPSGIGTKVDVVLKQGSRFWYYEIKTALTVRACIREAFGQLLEYAYWPGTTEPEKLIVVGEAELDSDGETYIKRLQERYELPIKYNQIVWERIRYVPSAVLPLDDVVPLS